MKRALVRDVTALGLGLAVLAPAAVASAQESCLEKVEEIQRHLDEREEILDPRTSEGLNMPNLAHLVEAARRFALQGEEERCFAVVDDMAGYLGRLADQPAVDRAGSSVVPDKVPTFYDEFEEEGYPGVPEEPGVEAFAEPGLGEPEDLEEAGLEETAEELRGGEEEELGSIEAREASEVAPEAGRREGVSPVAPPAPDLVERGSVAEPTAAPDDARIADLLVDEIVGMPLVNNWGREIGYIEGLVIAADGPGDVYAVVSESGALGIAGDEGVVPLERLRMAHPKAIQLRINPEDAGAGVEGLADLPAYDPAAGYRTVPRDERVGEVAGAQGLTVE